MSRSSHVSDLIEQLYEDSDPERRCPYLAKVGVGSCQCNSPTMPPILTPNRVGHIELQLYCLDGPERHPVCCFHPKCTFSPYHHAQQTDD